MATKKRSQRALTPNDKIAASHVSSGRVDHCVTDFFGDFLVGLMLFFFVNQKNGEKHHKTSHKLGGST